MGNDTVGKQRTLHWVWMVVCRYPFTAGSRSGWAFSSAFRDILKACTTECCLCAAAVCRVTEHIHWNCSTRIVLGAWAIWEGTAGWGSWVWGDGEQWPNLCRRATSTVLQVQGYFLITPSCPMGPSQALEMRDHVPRLMNAWRRAWKCTGPNNPGWRAVWGRGWACTEQCFPREGSGYPLWRVSNDGWRLKASVAHTPPWEFPLPPRLFPFRLWRLLEPLSNENSRSIKLKWEQQSKEDASVLTLLSVALLGCGWLCEEASLCSRKPKAVYVRGEKNVPVKD